jgi:calcineurin-like phosphoesterase family protein
MRTFFTADTHFHHNNILGYTDREQTWDSVAKMNEGLIKNWNSVVGKGDRVYILGDVALGGRSKATSLAEILERLHGDKYLVPGNHDTYILDSPECMAQINLLPPLHEIKISDPTLPKKKNGKNNRQTIVLCHFPMRVWNRNGVGAWHLFGHSHGSLDGIGKSFDVGIDGPHSNHRPMSYEEVREVMKGREMVLLDHHNEKTSY